MVPVRQLLQQEHLALEGSTSAQAFRGHPPPVSDANQTYVRLADLAERRRPAGRR